MTILLFVVLTVVNAVWWYVTSGPINLFAAGFFAGWAVCLGSKLPNSSSPTARRR